MSVLEWKKFNFFRLIPYAEKRKIRDCLKTKITAYISNSIYKIFCDGLGYVHIFFANWEKISFFANNSAIYLCAYSIETNLLITLSNADCISGVVLKVWDTKNLTKRNGAPSCIGTAVITSQYNATAMNVSYQNSSVCIAVGFERGEISIFRGQINREFSVGFRGFQSCSLRITGIEFKHKNSKCLNMFVSSDAGVFCYSITENNDIKESKSVLDAKNDPTPCCAMQTTNSAADPYFIVGRYDAIYCYTSDGRGPCYAIEGEKKSIAWFANYIVIAIHPTNTSFTTQKDNLIIIDINHKMIVLNKSIDSIAGILIDNKACFVLTDESDILAVFEKDINTKLELLMSKHLYDIALRLMKHENAEEKRVAHIYKLYGDHLYFKGDFEGAVEKYIKTIGVLEPYCIIRQFLGSKLVRYLSEYLNSLLKTEFATEEHVELFINCNSRMNLPVKLDEFLSDVNDIDVDEGTFKEIFCNINETMMSKTVMRQSDTNSQHQIFDTSLARLLRIMTSPSDVDQFFYQLSEHDIYGFFKEHGQTLTKYYIRQTTDILKSICVKEKIITCPENFIPLFSNQPLYCEDFLEHIIQNSNDCSPIIYNFLFELYLRRWKNNETDSQVLSRFLERYDKLYSRNEILIKCKNYCYWDGVLYFYKNKQFQNLSVRIHMRNGELKDIYNFYQSNSDADSKLWIQPLRDIEFVSEGYIALLQYVLSENSKKQLQSPLQILQSISEMKTSLLVHVKEFYLQEHLRYTGDLEKQSKIVSNLNGNLLQLNKLLKKYSFKPIEVRSNVCDICKQQLNYPSVYFICQHTFHKHCLSIYSDGEQYCISCEANNDKSVDKAFDMPVESFLSQLKQSDDFMELIKKCLEKRVFNENIYVNMCINNPVICSNPKEMNNSALSPKINDIYSKSTIVKRIPKAGESTNPFETSDDYTYLSSNPIDQYDANLNPFEE